ncbi:efflux transporter outer membrane subunit [Halosquirtibacter xylanolyticus]|uniref:efflux transporter outer membrane subunit n=1 Tax=Halosquirtibacter xylanolyticus TaxID=3374599 RepID=UPI00374A04C8|nr:efflux transporter outer membrane subunit [Prolixibacteraceae bacterium]
MRTIYKIITGSLIFSIVLLSGCKVGPDMKSPEIEMPSSYRFESENNDSIPDLDYWKVFKDTVLLNYIDQALKQNQDLEIAMTRIERSRISLGISKTMQLPSISFDSSAGIGTMTSGGNVLTSKNDQYSLFPQLSWEIDVWGKYRRNKESALANLTKTNYGYRAVTLSIISQVANNYFTLLDYRNRYLISKKTYLSRMENYKIIKDRFETGYVALLDVNQAEIQMNIALNQMYQLRRMIGQAENAMSILLGTMPKKINTYSELFDRDVPYQVPVGIPTDLLLRRPDIMQSYYNIMGLNAEVGVAVAQRFPSLSLTAAGGLASDDATNFFESNSLQWSVYGMLAGPIFNFGRNKKKVEIARIKVKAAVLQYEKTVMQSVQEVEDILIEIDTYRKQLDATTDILTAAKSAYELSKARYDQGVVSYLEVLDSEKTYFQAQLSLSRIYTSRINSFVQLYKALGGGWHEMEVVE